MLTRIDKTGSLGPWSRVPNAMGESFWQKGSLLQYIHYDYDPVLPPYTVIQNPRSRSLIRKWSSYKKYFFHALGNSLHHIF